MLLIYRETKRVQLEFIHYLTKLEMKMRNEPEENANNFIVREEK